MPRRTFYAYGLEDRRIRLVLPTPVWQVVDADAKKLDMSVPALLELIISERARASSDPASSPFGGMFPREHVEEERP